MKPQHLFITGTDTEVGKTAITAGLLKAADRAGHTCLGLKPVAAGCEYRAGQWQNDDALQLMAAANDQRPYAQINPVALPAPVSPHIAAQLASTRINARDLIQHCASMTEQPVDLMCVEGAGGWYVPINETETLADVAAGLQYPVVVVVGIRLGCINHALLTLQAIQASGLPVAAWVANCMEPATDNTSEILQTLTQRIHAPCLGVVPFLKDAAAETVADYLSLECLFEVEEDECV